MQLVFLVLAIMVIAVSVSAVVTKSKKPTAKPSGAPISKKPTKAPAVSKKPTKSPVAATVTTAAPVTIPGTAKPVLAVTVTTAKPVVATVVTAKPVVAAVTTAKPVVVTVTTAKPVVATVTTAAPVAVVGATARPTQTLTALTIQCPTGSFVSKIVSHVGATMDNFVATCDDAAATVLPIIGRTTANSKLYTQTGRIDSMKIGYGKWNGLPIAIVASMEVCSAGVCSITFGLGQTTCSTDVTQTFACKTIASFTAPVAGKFVCGFTTISTPAVGAGFVNNIVPLYC